MHYVAIVSVLAFAQVIIMGVLVARARGRYGVAAPSVTGHEVFERYFRVHLNTLEQLVIFIPSMWLFAHYVSPRWAAAAGVLFLVGRVVYATSYIRDPKSRSLGFALGAVPMLLMMVGVLVSAIHALMTGQ
ncbi:MAG TPA: MAPEG family protein [Povalibacter sp.]|nr:MAPEG family protein [Povalibacter sp.]